VLQQVRRWLVAVAAQVARATSGRTVLVLTAVIGAVLVAGLTVAGAGVYDAVEEGDGIAGLDRPALNEALAVRTPVAARLVTAFTQLGGPAGMTVIALALTAVLVWRRRSWTPLLLMVLAVAGSLVFTMVGKAVVGRARPPLADAVPPYEYAFSFPSGHALNSTVIAGTVAYLALPLLRHRWSRVVSVVAAAVWAVAIGLSRVYLGHHWLTDVCFAWLLGLAWLALLITAHRLFLLTHRARADPSSRPVPGPRPHRRP
jgi:undecaprenyl-diphosphatase